LSAQFSWDCFHQLPVVGILRGFASDQIEPMVAACNEGGLVNVEVTMNTADAAWQIGRLTAAFGATVNVGAGTVRSLKDLDRAREAGATFIVTPAVVPEVIVACKTAGIPVFAGALTPSEVLQAWQLGASMVKIFPADALGPTYIASLKAPFDEIPLMPTGGIGCESIAPFRQAGASAVGVGGPLFSKPHAAAGDWAWFTKRAESFAHAWNHAP
jgi:2-dehydro-3-deoxyphosphogluconate aldolase/(4S)-4-hydroxy-2-oxoglutarate aldolase